MTWGKVDDGLHSHPKWTRVSPNAKAVWCTALSYCNAYLTNGVIDMQARGQIAVETFGYTGDAFDLFDAAAAELVAVRAPESTAGLWKVRRGAGGGWVFHQWDEHQPDAEDEKLRKFRNTRRAQLHNTSKGRRLKAQVYELDGGLCRYCGVKLDLTNPGGAGDSITYEHVDPNGPNSLDNVVLCCGRCNRRKSGRSLEEAGMTLLPRGTAALTGTAEHSADRSAPEVARGVARTGPGRSRGRDGSGRDGSGRVGSGRDGSGRDGSGGAGVGDGDGSGPDELTDAWLRAQYEQTMREAG